MKVGLIDVDGHNFPNLALMKISAYYKALGNEVEFVKDYFNHYDKIYVSKVFGDEYSRMDFPVLNADEIIYGGTGFAITIENGKEVFHKDRDKELPYEIEHIYPDYDLYSEFTKNKAFGFLTRGCPNDCEFCLVTEKEGRCSIKVADLSEFWRGQKEIVLLDPNLLACKDRENLLKQLIDSKAKIDFTQGLDARFINEKTVSLLKQINAKMWHFAFDFMKNEKQIIKGLTLFMEEVKANPRNSIVYVLTNFDTSFVQDYYRVKKIQKLDMTPDIRIYRKESLNKNSILRHLQRWCNNRFIYRSVKDFFEYAPHVDGKTIKELYPKEYAEWRQYESKL